MKNEARVVFRTSALRFSAFRTSAFRTSIAPITLLMAMLVSLSGSVSATLLGQEPLFQRLDRVLGESSAGVVSARDRKSTRLNSSH